ncbi:alpha/beta hydrolase family esterase [Epilithonimonas hungarica]|uniref:Polyhydroxybutyrate depolymerase n=1 Tax=Epilithonimonas hungarica TaxID=454006 RepID=A0A1G7RUW9_9FLAO|nr:acetylxylan esterase [Epilithonimonas hungarica]SDG14585.1 polyhydroxybutyrate depolymerase [Epilithonimonas hungarica]
MKNYFILFFFAFNILIFSQTTKNYNIDGTSRKAIIYEPTAKSDKVPVVFVFHGHGGNANFVSKRIDVQNYYKEALVIFMEGLPGRKVPGIDPNGRMNGWQIFTDDLEGRDIQFFDEVFSDIHRRYKIDDSRIYLIGHSNGARFVNVLWKMRGDKITAICSASAQGGNLISGAVPISVWMYIGNNDRIVSPQNQEQSIPIVKKNLGITDKEKTGGDKTYFTGKNNTELVLQQSDAGHEFPKSSLADIVVFLKKQAKN